MKTAWNWEYYLIIGTGKAWAWHSRAKLVLTALTKMLPLESLENVGALEPTGSKGTKNMYSLNIK